MSQTALEFRVMTARVGENDYIVTVAGQLDAAATRQFRDTLFRLARKPEVRVLVDGLGLSSVEAEAVAALADAAECAHAGGGEISVVADSLELVRLLRVTGFDR